MTTFEQHEAVIKLAKCTMPTRLEGEPLFRDPWHARIFALIVALVQDGHFEWQAFQTRLALELKAHQSVEAALDADEIDRQYFDCWLHAAEDLLTEGNYLAEAHISDQVEAIRLSVTTIRNGQLGQSAVG